MNMTRSGLKEHDIYNEELPIFQEMEAKPQENGFDEMKDILDERYKLLSAKYPFADSRAHIIEARNSNLQRYGYLCGHRFDQKSLNSNGDLEGASLLTNGGNMARTTGNHGNLESTRPMSHLTLGNNEVPESPVRENGTAFGGENQVMEYCAAEDLVVIRQEARHPQFTDITERLLTFSNWKHSHIQEPNTLAQAGFFHSGEEDRVRCFFCNGGLANWEESDIPWMEHHRWFGNCPYVKQCRKNPVVAAILDTAQQANAMTMNHSHCHQHNRNGRTQCDIETQSENIQTNIERKETVNTLTEHETRQKHTTNDDKLNIQSPPPQDFESIKQENETLKTTRTCKVCLDSGVEVIFLPCSHIVCCMGCSFQLQECPVCRAHIKATARVHV